MRVMRSISLTVIAVRSPNTIWTKLENIDTADTINDSRSSLSIIDAQHGMKKRATLWRVAKQTLLDSRGQIGERTHILFEVFEVTGAANSEISRASSLGSVKRRVASRVIRAYVVSAHASICRNDVYSNVRSDDANQRSPRLYPDVFFSHLAITTHSTWRSFDPSVSARASFFVRAYSLHPHAYLAIFDPLAPRRCINESAKLETLTPAIGGVLHNTPLAHSTTEFVNYEKGREVDRRVRTV